MWAKVREPHCRADWKWILGNGADFGSFSRFPSFLNLEFESWLASFNRNSLGPLLYIIIYNHILMYNSTEVSNILNGFRSRIRSNSWHFVSAIIFGIVSIWWSTPQKSAQCGDSEELRTWRLSRAQRRWLVVCLQVPNFFCHLMQGWSEKIIGLWGPDILILDYRTINLIMSFLFGLNLDVMSLDVSWTWDIPSGFLTQPWKMAHL